MEALLLERMREGLLQKQDNLTEWLHATPLGKKKVLLGPSTEQSVHARLYVIDDAISKADSKTLGKCEVCHEVVETELLEVDYTACVCIEHLSKEERHQLERELELAQDVQKTLLPQEVPKIPGLEIAAFSRPAQLWGETTLISLILATASWFGHSRRSGSWVSASLHMASIQALLLTLVPVNKSPAEVMGQLHKLFIHNIRFETFVTFFIGAFDSSTKTLTFSNAGHLPPLVLRNNKSKKESVEMLRPTGAAIGLVEEAEFAEKTIELQKEDLLVLYTDGITEAVNLQNQEFGRERLIKLIQQVNNAPVKQVVQEIRQGLGEFSEGKPLADDATIVICKIK